jgi:hypothetical protein
MPFLMLAALSGCFSITEPNYEPEAMRPARPVRAAWVSSDGPPPHAEVSTRPAPTPLPPAAPAAPEPVTASAAKVPAASAPAAAKTTTETVAKAPAETPATEVPPAVRTTGPAMADANIDPTLVQATYTEVPRNHGHDLPPVNTNAKSDSTCGTTIAPGPHGSTLRLVNSRRIAFRYEVKDAGASSCVEVWGTQDMKNWKKYDVAAQKGKSHIIEVKDEGLYGFTLLAQGPGGKGPMPGDAPQVWVAVDCTRPVVQFVGAELNILAKAPTLVLRWAAGDRNLGPRPVSLFYAEQSEGPWTLLAGNVENTGRYEWLLPANLPSALYLRVQAADLMGNVGMAQTPNLLHNLQAATAAAHFGHGPELGTALREPDRLQLPQAVPLPKTPSLDVLHAPPTAEPSRTQVNIVEVGAEKD